MNNYLWLQKKWKEENYLPSQYYNKLLKPYIFGGLEDTAVFKNFLETLSACDNALELGCGTGRGSHTFRGEFPKSRFEMLDLSETMINCVKPRFDSSLTSFVCQDSLSYMSHTKNTYDLVFSLWSFSHSIHQTMEKLTDQRKGFESIEGIFETFLRNNIRSGGSFYLIHFDSQSEEQRILLKQWAKIHPLYSAYKEPSHSYKMIEKSLKKLSDQGYLEYDIQHLKGEPITYKNMDEALEIFINFHLEGALQRTNDTDITNSVLEDLRTYFEDRQTTAGEIIIQPGCYIMKATIR